MKKSISEVVRTVAGGLSAFTGLILAVVELTKQLESVHTSFLGVSTIWVLWSISTVLALLGIHLVWRGLSRKSRLLHPEALLIDPDNPEHLQGRRDDIRRLCESVSQNPLVFLEGESGAGKSALIRSGLIPAMTENEGGRKLLPIYINSYGGDWELGPEEQLVLATWAALGEEKRSILGIKSLEDAQARLWLLPEPLLPGDDAKASLNQQGNGVLYQIRNELGLIPLLIFDQFDDYQVNNRSRFLRDGRWLRAKQLVEENQFWRNIQHTYYNKSIHCLFVTRSELFGGLEAVRFQEPESFFLSRVEPAYFAALLEKLVVTPKEGEPVILNPDAGWETLKDHLIRKLSEQGRILPIQARIVFKGLIELPFLSVGAFERAGGMEGLEAAYVDDSVSAAASRSGVSHAQVRRLLVEMVENDNPKLAKSRSVPEQRLFEVARIEHPMASRVLETLEQVGIVRASCNLQFGGEPVYRSWALYHDYLANAVLAAHRKSQRWQWFLADKLRSWARATSWRGKWSALLTPTELIYLLWHSLRGQLHWSGYRAFAFLSTIRFIPFVVILISVVIASDHATEWQAYQKVRTIVAGIRGGAGEDIPTKEELYQLFKLSSGSSRLKLAFLKSAVSDGSSSRELLKHTDYVFQSLIGLDPNLQLRKQLLEEVSVENGSSATVGEELQVLRAVWLIKTVASAPRDLSNFIPQTLDSSLALMAHTTNANKGEIFWESLTEFVEKLPADLAMPVTRRLLGEMVQTTNPFQAASLGQIVTERILVKDLPQKQVIALVSQMIAKMEDDETDEYLLGELGRMLVQLHSELPAHYLENIAPQVVTAMERIADTERQVDLGRELNVLHDEQSVEQSISLAELLIAAIARSTPNKSEGLRLVLEHLVEWGPAKQSPIVAEQLALELVRTDDTETILFFSKMLYLLNGELTEMQMNQLAEQLVTKMEATVDEHQLSTLGIVLASLGNKVPTEYVARGAQCLLSAMEKVKHVGPELLGLSEALGEFGARLPNKYATANVRRLVAEMARNDSPHTLKSLAGLLQAYGGQLPAAQATEVGQQLLVAMKQSVDGYTVAALGKTLASLGKNLPVEDFVAGARYILARMNTNEDYEMNRKLERALGLMTEEFSPIQAASVADKLTSMLVQLKDMKEAVVLESALRTSAEMLREEEARKLAMRLIDEIQKKSTHGYHVASLSRVLTSGRLVEALSVEETAVVAQHLIEAMEPGMSEKLALSLGKSLADLGINVPVGYAEVAAERLIAAWGGSYLTERRDLRWVVKKWFEKLPSDYAIAAIAELDRTLEEPGAHYDEDVWITWEASNLIQLGEKLLSDPASVFAQELVSALVQATNTFQLKTFETALSKLSANLSENQAMSLARQLAAVMKEPVSVNKIAALGTVLGSLGHNLPSEYAAAGAQQVVVAIGNTDDVTNLLTLGKALGRLGDNLTSEFAAEGVIQLLTSLARMENAPYPPDEWIRVYSELATHLSLEQAHLLADQLVQAFEPTQDQDPDKAAVLCTMLGQLGQKLPTKSAVAGAKQIEFIMGQTTDEHRLAELGKALGSLGEKVPDRYITTAAQRLVSIVTRRETPNRNAIDDLLSSLALLFEKLPQEQVIPFAHQLTSVMERSMDEDILYELGIALGNLGQDLPSEEVAAIARTFVVAMDRVHHYYFLAQLAEQLSQIESNLSVEYAALAAKRITAVMMQNTHREDEMSSLANALHALSLQAPNAVGQIITDTLTDLDNPHGFKVLTEMLRGLNTASAQFNSSAVYVLAHPMAVKDARDDILTYFGRLAGEDFSDTQEIVDWMRRNNQNVQRASSQKSTT